MRILSPSLNALESYTHDETNNADPNTIDKGHDTTTAKQALNVARPVPGPSSGIPTVVLDTDVVSAHMAARLCTSFLGHVLFLKNQVPFPIVQLARMPTSDTPTRAEKKRHELLSSFDTLTSHLYTTFVALSTALALRGVADRRDAPRERGVTRAFVAVALGPSVGTAKARVVVGIDGLETRVWGLRDDDAREENDSDEGDSPLDEKSNTDVEEEEAESSDEGGDESDDDASPPPSRSPSPSSSESDSEASSHMPLHSKPVVSRTEDPQTVLAAERLLSRTLASACAEDDGHGLACEMAPTQIHVLLRAPRRFDHPSWTPRQNWCVSMEGHLAEFLVASGEIPVEGDVTGKKQMKRAKAQGVWVKSRGNVSESEPKAMAEEDEMLWWSWDGKLVGFSDW